MRPKSGWTQVHEHSQGDINLQPRGLLIMLHYEDPEFPAPKDAHASACAWNSVRPSPCLLIGLSGWSMWPKASGMVPLPIPFISIHLQWVHLSDSLFGSFWKQSPQGEIICLGVMCYRGAAAQNNTLGRQTSLPRSIHYTHFTCSEGSECNAEETRHRFWIHQTLVLRTPNTGSKEMLIKKNYYEVLILELIPILISNRDKICEDLEDYFKMSFLYVNRKYL